jgi:hypothetical protein
LWFGQCWRQLLARHHIDESGCSAVAAVVSVIQFMLLPTAAAALLQRAAEQVLCMGIQLRMLWFDMMTYDELC